MIVFDLKCEKEHRFESWFKSSAAYEELKVAGHLECPLCNSTDITKAPMAPNIGAKSNQRSEVPVHVKTPETETAAVTVPAQAPTTTNISGPEFQKLVGAAQKMFTKIREHVEKNCEDVGQEFAEEARKIHYGESAERGIYGSATREETEELLDEGIDVLPIPISRPTDA